MQTMSVYVTAHIGTALFACLTPMEVNFTPEQEEHLAQLAANAGTHTERLVRDTVLRLLDASAGAGAMSPGSVVVAMRALRARVKPDSEGWTTRDYVRFGRR